MDCKLNCRSGLTSPRSAGCETELSLGHRGHSSRCQGRYVATSSASSGFSARLYSCLCLRQAGIENGKTWKTAAIVPYLVEAEAGVTQSRVLCPASR